MNDMVVGLNAEISKEPGGLLTRCPIPDYKEPFRFDNLDQFKRLMIGINLLDVSDIYIQTGLPICIRKSGKLLAVTNRVVDGGECYNMLKWGIGRDTAQTDIMSGESVDGRFEVFDPHQKDSRGSQLRRGFRVNASPIYVWGATGVQIVMRTIPNDPMTIQEVGLDEGIARAMAPKNGFVLVAGDTGSGKTTTFAAVMRYILEGDTPIKGNIITHEEPIEFTYQNIQSKHSIIVQSQIPTHFKTFRLANKAAMRRKPAAILIGELRDEETIMSAVEAAVTGHPVFATVHSTNVSTVVSRLISRFPIEQRATAINDIITCARVIMAQRLVMGVDGKLLAAREYLIFTPAIRRQLCMLESMDRLTTIVEDLVQVEGNSFAAEGRRLLAEGRISQEVADTLIHET